MNAKRKYCVVTVYLEDGTFYKTEVNHLLSDEEHRGYFVNKSFNLRYDEMIRCCDIAITRGEE